MFRYTDIISTLRTEDDKELYNRYITLDEVEEAISRLKSRKTPTLDMYPTDLFIQGGENMRAAIHRFTLQEMCCVFWFSREMWYRKSALPSTGTGGVELKIDEKMQKLLFV